MHLALLLVHFATLAVLLFGYLQSMNEGVPSKLMLWGARLQLLSGLAMAGISSMGDDKISPAYLACKLVVMLAVLGVTEAGAARARKGAPNPVLVHVAAGLVLLNFVFAYSLPR